MVHAHPVLSPSVLWITVSKLPLQAHNTSTTIHTHTNWTTALSQKSDATHSHKHVLESGLRPLTPFRIPSIFVVHMALILNTSFCISINFHLDSKVLASHSHSEVSVSILGDIEMRCELCSARAEEKGGEVLLVGCLYVLNMVCRWTADSSCLPPFAFPFHHRLVQWFSLSYIRQTEFALMLCRLLDASKEDSKFLPTLFPCFSARTCQAEASKVECNRFNSLSEYLNRPCFKGIHSLNARDKLSRLD